MELVYLFIKNHYEFNNAEFSFNGNFQFELEIEPKTQISKLIISDKKYIPFNFFENNILNTAAIIGKNGSGKTLVLEFLAKWLSGSANIINEQYISVFFDRKENKINVYYNFDNDTTGNVFSTSKKKNSKWKLIVDTNLVKNHQIEFHEEGSCFNTESIVYYNGYLDHKDYPPRIDTRKYSDVSTTYLLYADFHHNTTDHYNADQVSVNRYENTNRLFSLLNKDFDFKYLKTVPDKIQVRFNKREAHVEWRDLPYELREKGDHDLYKIDLLTSKSFSVENDLIYEASTDEEKLIGLRAKCKKWFIINLLENFIANFSIEKNYNVSIPIKHIDEYIQSNDIKGFIMDVFNAQTFVNKDDFDLNSFMAFVENLIDNKAQFDHFHDDNESFFYLEVSDAHQLFEYYNKYILSYPKHYRRYIKGFMDLNIRDMSSGELALLNLFSRINYGIEKISNKEFVYLLIDEGELGFHPDWQKNYLMMFFEFLKNYDSKFVIIVTSHSPFLVSDIPGLNLIYLDNQKIVKRENAEVLSFGANIHELYSDSFFVNGGLMGSFAKKKIDELFNWYTNPSNLSNVEVKMTIDLIGEPIIKFKLLELYNLKTGEDVELDQLNIQLAALKNKIEIKQKNDKNRG